MRASAKILRPRSHGLNFWPPEGVGKDFVIDGLVAPPSLLVCVCVFVRLCVGRINDGYDDITTRSRSPNASENKLEFDVIFGPILGRGLRNPGLAGDRRSELLGGSWALLEALGRVWATLGRALDTKSIFGGIASF